MVLVDTSVWIDHLRNGNARMKSLLHRELVLCHPFIVGELACGILHSRREILGLLAALPVARVAEHDEVLHLVETRDLSGRGLGWIDAHLLASALITGCSLWTLDGRLQKSAAALNLSA
jgi:predicted nucleic acid-binding protein